MAIYEIQSLKPVKDPIIQAIISIPISESVKQKDMEADITISEFNSGKISEDIMKTAEEKIQRVSELMNDYVRSIQRDIKIKVDYKTGNIVVKVISQDGKVIREIPPEELLALAAKMEELSGVLFDQIV